jgi:uncharacterized protein (TIGR02001 family)
MYRYSFRYIFLVSILVTIIHISDIRAEVSFNGNITGVSTYIWRGIRQNNSSALQATAALEASVFSGGLWVSNVDFGPDSPTLESDLFFEFHIPAGESVSAILGTTIYTYDFFKTFNDDARQAIEIYFKSTYQPFGLSVYYVPAQASTKKNLLASLYWFEFSAAIDAFGANFSSQFSFGTYSSRYLPEPQTKPVSLLVLSAAKPVYQSLTAGMMYSLGLSKGLSNLFWFYLSLDI